MSESECASPSARVDIQDSGSLRYGLEQRQQNVQAPLQPLAVKQEGEALEAVGERQNHAAIPRVRNDGGGGRVRLHDRQT